MIKPEQSLHLPPGKLSFFRSRMRAIYPDFGSILTMTFHSHFIFCIHFADALLSAHETIESADATNAIAMLTIFLIGSRFYI